MWSRIVETAFCTSAWGYAWRLDSMYCSVNSSASVSSNQAPCTSSTAPTYRSLQAQHSPNSAPSALLPVLHWLIQIVADKPSLPGAHKHHTYMPCCPLLPSKAASMHLCRTCGDIQITIARFLCIPTHCRYAMTACLRRQRSPETPLKVVYVSASGKQRCTIDGAP